MATSVSSDAQKVLSGLDSAAQKYITSQGAGNKLTSGEARTLLAAYNADPSKALSSTNVAATTTAPTYAPDDLLGIRKSISNELGIPDKESAYSAAYKALKDYDLETENAARLINEQQISTNVLSGQEATARKLRSQERLSLASEAEIAQAALLAAKEELNVRYGIQAENVANIRQIILSNPEAGITFSDTTESAAKKIADYNKKVQKEAEEKAKDEYKDKVRSTLMSLGISTKTSKGGSLSLAKMEKALTEYYKKQGMDDKELKDLEKAIKRKSLSEADKQGQRLSVSEKKAAAIDSAYNALYDAPKGTDGNVSPDDYRSAMSVARAGGATTREINEALSGFLSDDAKKVLGIPVSTNKVSKQERDAYINAEIAAYPEQWNNLDDDGKAQYVRSMGGNPADFNIPGYY